MECPADTPYMHSDGLCYAEEEQVNNYGNSGNYSGGAKQNNLRKRYNMLGGARRRSTRKSTRKAGRKGTRKSRQNVAARQNARQNTMRKNRRNGRKDRR